MLRRIVPASLKYEVQRVVGTQTLAITRQLQIRSGGQAELPRQELL